MREAASGLIELPSLRLGCFTFLIGVVRVVLRLEFSGFLDRVLGLELI